ncbi:hypothetical protein PR048_031206 [Dryococelus australis]|uniref:Uncharacterized protein n=1 Tax=Dryococelus australis TaxID=614101 RepID=A0ABQ9G4L4_9NEOP|nr:hypothetical protein PR048_031206 [Dryococelus australis]
MKCKTQQQQRLQMEMKMRRRVLNLSALPNVTVMYRILLSIAVTSCSMSNDDPFETTWETRLMAIKFVDSFL